MIFTKIVIKGTIVDLKDNNKGFVLEDEMKEILFFIDQNYINKFKKGDKITITIEDIKKLEIDDEKNYYGVVEHYLPGGFYYSTGKKKNIIQKLLLIEAKGLLTYTGKNLSNYFEIGEQFKITLNP